MTMMKSRSKALCFILSITLCAGQIILNSDDEGKFMGIERRLSGGKKQLTGGIVTKDKKSASKSAKSSKSPKSSKSSKKSSSDRFPTDTPHASPITPSPTTAGTTDPPSGITNQPTDEPVATPSPTTGAPGVPTPQPSEAPTPAPTTVAPTATGITPSPTTGAPGVPTPSPTDSFTPAPTTGAPAEAPVAAVPTPSPTTPAPTPIPTAAPTSLPSQLPSQLPTGSSSPSLSFAPSPELFCEDGITASERQQQLLDIVSTFSSPLDINVTGTPQQIAFDWLLNVDSVEVCPENDLDVIQRYTLATLYYSTDGDNWDNCSENTASPCTGAERFLSGSSVCTWFGISCDTPDGPITEIDLEANGLSGVIPNEVGILSAIITFNLGEDAGQNIFGPIPTTLGNLAAATEIFLARNNINGTIPTELGSLNLIDALEIGFNDLTGPLPTELLNLRSLDALLVSFNMLTGEIPTGINSLTELKFFDVAENQFEGTLPTTLGLLTGLQVGNFFNNSFSGPVPSELGLLGNLTQLFLHENNFSGSMPAEICILRTNGNLLTLTADCAGQDSDPSVFQCNCCLCF